jgi:HD-like signal output (HDOD) protein
MMQPSEVRDHTMEVVFDQAVKLPSISKAVSEIVGLTRSEDVNIPELIERIKMDQTIAAKVIRVANSSFYMQRGRVSTVDRGVHLIGLTVLRTTVLTAGVKSAFTKIPGIRMQRYWRLVLTSAFMAIAMAPLFGYDSEEAFTAALMQGLGVLMLHMRMPTEASAVAELVDPIDFEQRIAVDIETFGMSHAELAGDLLRRWRFPEKICKTLEEYPSPKGENLLGKILFAASHYAYGKIGGKREKIIAAELLATMPEGPAFNEQWLQSQTGSISKWVDSVLP